MRDGKRAEKLSLYEDWHVWGLMRAHPPLAHGNERGTGERRVQHVTPRPQRVIVFSPSRLPHQLYPKSDIIHNGHCFSRPI